MLMFESSCKAILSHRHDITGMPDRENHHPVFDWSIELFVLSSNSDQDSNDDYPEIGNNAYWNPAIEAHYISMVGLARGNSQNSSSKYSTIGGSEVSDAWTPSSNIVQNLYLDFNVVRLHTIMESIQQMVPHDSPFIALA
jgi:hypothetical protein